MSLRQAKFDDHWRHVFARNYPTRFAAVELRSLYCLADAAIEFTGGVTAIVGGNGVGKSTFAAAVAELLLVDPNTAEEDYKDRLRGSASVGTAFASGNKLRLCVQDAGEGRTRTADTFEEESRWLEPSALAVSYVSQIHADTNFQDLLDPITPLSLDAEELKIASYLVGKDYTGIDIYEIADYGDFERFPYFRVASSGITYGSEGMGRGELSLLLVYWTLRDLPKHSILILEEPETHVSPKSQDALMNIVAKFCDEKGLWVLVTTHSPTILRRIRRENIVLLARSQGPAELILNATKLQMALLLGGGIAYRSLVIVEDRAAKSFLVALLQILEPDLYRQCEVVAAESKSNVTTLLKVMPRTREWFMLIGAYDGDVRSEIDGEGFKWPFFFLPGESKPEELLMRAVQHTNAVRDALPSELRAPAEQVGLALQHATGEDPHEYFQRFANAISLEYEVVFRGFVLAWLQDDENLRAAKLCLSELSNAMENTHISS